jgi:hypothetical protein
MDFAEWFFLSIMYYNAMGIIMNPSIISSKELKRHKKGHKKTIIFKKYATSL